MRTLIIWIGICALFYVFDKTWLSLVLGIVLLIYAAFNVALTIQRMRVTVRFFADLFADDSAQFNKLRATTSSLFLTQRTATYTSINSTLFLVGIPYLFLALFLGLNWWSVPILLASFHINMSWRQLNPPVAVFLSTSEPDQIELCTELQYRVFPLKIVNMLSMEAIKAQKHLKLILAALDGNRLAKSANWEDQISKIMSCVPLIIMDLRSPSAGLKIECDLINRHGWHWKLVAIHSQGADIDHLEDEVFRSGNAQRGVIAWVRAADLPKTIVHSIIVGKQLPRIDRPAGMLLIPPEFDYEDWRLGEPYPRRAESYREAPSPAFEFPAMSQPELEVLEDKTKAL